MIDGPTEEVMKLEPLKDKFVAFGFNTLVVDGNNINELCGAIDSAIERSKEPCAPTCIIMDTKKGAGIKTIAGDYLWHYGGINDELFEKFNKELDEDYAERVARAEKEGK
jgi:transketolase